MKLLLQLKMSVAQLNAALTSVKPATTCYKYKFRKNQKPYINISSNSDRTRQSQYALKTVIAEMQELNSIKNCLQKTGCRDGQFWLKHAPRRVTLAAENPVAPICN
ncbi:hypothetical protein [Pseudomonas pudica]|uniref:Uncharacterized protein n=1 Tax=Pseudomonas pudica TaxID=272772 RepID=A0ABS0FZG9_9PSED|nr:hypothetical protein [Pseudomonas pudica]MBF8645689.1 hypothetical protein [Pseudomonas pudica]MBF8760399.1 hypothetical protein [Pseudomonas pudica]